LNDLDSLHKEIDKIKWYHTIDLGNGIKTKGKSETSTLLKNIKLDDDLTGKTVLDIGAWDGFFSFEAEKRGAKKVLAVDSYSWNGSGWGSKAGFNLAKKVFNSKVEDMEVEVLDISPQKMGTFDVVLFLGVLYHMINPLLALEKVASVTKEKLILETAVDMLGTNRPVIAFYPKDEVKKDLTNWCGPNPQAVIAMLEHVGFKKVEKIHQQPLTKRLGEAILNEKNTSYPFFERTKMARAIFHAWK